MPPAPARNPRESLYTGPQRHRVILGDARTMPELASSSVHLVVTSPPYANLKRYAELTDGQLGHIDNYDDFLVNLEQVLAECARVLVPGGRICAVVAT